MSAKPGPYVTETGPEVWFPVWAYTLNEARHEASQHAAETIGNWGRARSIRKRARAGETHLSIAQSLGVGETTIRRVVIGRRWAHVQDHTGDGEDRP